MPEDTGSPADAGLQATEEGGSQEVPADQEPVDWQQRYQDTRSNHDRLAAENEQYQQLFEDPALLARAVQATGLDQESFLEALGYGVPEDEEEDIEYDDDPNAELAQRLEALEAQTAQQAQAEEAAQLEDLENAYFEQEIGKIAQAEGRELTNEELEALDALGDRIVGDDGLPDYEAAWKRFGQLTEARHKAYLQSKRASGVAAGTAGEESIDWSDPDAAHKAATDAVQAVLEAEEG